MKVNLCTICSDVIVEIGTGLVSIVKMYESIIASKFPMVVPSMCFFILLEKGSLEPDMFIGTIVIKINGKTEKAIPVSADFQGKTRCNMTMKFEGFPVAKKGTVELSLMDGVNQVAKATIDVKAAGASLIKKPDDGSGIAIM